MAKYLWSGPEKNGSTSKCITIATAGRYTLNITNAAGCGGSCYVDIIAKIPQDCFIQGNTTVCEGQCTVLTGPNGKISYKWEGPNGFTNYNQTIIACDPGWYWLYDVSGNGCTNSCKVYLTVNPRPQCNLTVIGSLPITNNQPVTLCAPTGMRRYVWFGPQNNGITNRCNTVVIGGTYTVTLTDTNGCETNCNVNVQNQTPQPCTISGNTSICSNSTTLLVAANGMLQYLWSGPEQNGATTQFIVVGTEGPYCVRQVDGNGLTNSEIVLSGHDNHANCTGWVVKSVLARSAKQWCEYPVQHPQRGRHVHLGHAQQQQLRTGVLGQDHRHQMFSMRTSGVDAQGWL
jgi:hypothetical protein